MPKGGGDKGKKGRKFGRNGRRPSTSKRKSNRPDLVRKACHVVRSGGDLKAWAERRYKIEGQTDSGVSHAVNVAKKLKAKLDEARERATEAKAHERMRTG